MTDTFPILEQYSNYMLAVLGRSELTVTEYLYDRFVVFGRTLDTNKRAAKAAEKP